MTTGPAYPGRALSLPEERRAQVTGGVSRLDDEDYPAVTMGQAAELLEVQPAFLRSLDAAGVVSPGRSAGGHRRYSRRQLERAARLRVLVDAGMNLEGAIRILELEDDLAAAHTRITELERRLAGDAPTAEPREDAS
jgi:MerR family transcriptional regulator/heat shock protein HspR